MDLFKGVLTMLVDRETCSDFKYPEAREMLNFIDRSSMTSEDFEKAIVLPTFKNYMRNVIAAKYVEKFGTKTKVPLRLLMSISMTNGISGKSTLVVFLSNESSKISAKLSLLVFDVIHDYNLKDIPIEDVIVVTDKPLPTEFYKFAEAAKNYRISVFEDYELIVKSFESVYSPKMRIMSESESKTFLEKNQLKKIQYPRISNRDAQVKYLGGCPGRFVEIIRVNLIPQNIVDQTLTYSLITK